MTDKTTFLNTIPVIPSQDIERDIKWYKRHTGFKYIFGDNMYASIKREHIEVHLQWHADNEDDPLLGGSVVKIFVKNIQPIFHELVERGALGVQVQYVQPTLIGRNRCPFRHYQKICLGRRGYDLLQLGATGWPHLCGQT